jgi:hypothetical protein
MKSTFTAIVVLLLFLPASIVFGQYVELGLKLGPNIGFISGNGLTDLIQGWDDFGDDKTGMRLGVTGGLFFSISIFEFLAVQPELIFTNSGASYEYNDAAQSPEPIKGETNVTILELPILLKPRFAVGGGILYFLVGPEISIVMGLHRFREDVDGDIGTGGYVVDNDMLIGVVAAAGYGMPLGPGLLITELRFHRSFVSLYDDDDYLLNAIQILVGYEVILGGAE